MDAVYFEIISVFFSIIVKQNLFTIRKIDNPQRILVSGINRRHIVHILLCLTFNFITIHINLRPLCLKHTNCLAIYEQEIISFKIML